MRGLAGTLNQGEFVHQRRLSGLPTSSRGVERTSRGIRRAGENPGLDAPQPRAVVQEGSEQPSPEPLPLVRGRHANLVDPELRGLVGMNVVHRRGEAHHRLLVQSHRKMMSRILEELDAPPGHDPSVEHPRRNPVEQRPFLRPEYADLDRHPRALLRPKRTSLGWGMPCASFSYNS